METIYETQLPAKLAYRGKVRDTYDLGDRFLMVASDRLSAFDVVFRDPVPYKGSVLTMLSKFWFEKTKPMVKNHVLSYEVPAGMPPYLRGRGMQVVKAKPILIECVVRGYLTGSALKEYKESGGVCGIKLPSGLKDGSRLEEPIFTPAYKAPLGQHDENITAERAMELEGKETVDFVKKKSLEIYKMAREYAYSKGLVLADTKFEFGYLGDEIIVIDEMLTPDSSRYWVRESYDKGVLESLDKQYVRNYLEKLGWDKKPPAPPLPKEIIEKTTERYLSAYRMLTGNDLTKML
ncbi:MAG: phosphoribosylaminoimidazolesuccinocarboxamide synthase [Candidatus Bilamarchaeaceae archaeon]